MMATFALFLTRSRLSRRSVRLAHEARMRIAPVIALGALLCIAPGRATAADPWVLLLTTRSLKCTFPKGAFADWEKGSPKIKSASFKNPLHFDSLDPKAGSARFIGNVGATDVTLIVSPGGLTFIETTALGGFISTTVFASFAKPGTTEFVAVHSRHIPGILSMSPPIPSQYHGTCKRWH